jgi:hydroxymethylbilane synthase
MFLTAYPFWHTKYLHILHRRVPPEDVIVLKANCKYKTWEDLVQEPGNVIGTSSVRRQAQLRAKWPNLEFNDIRGNLNTRLRKLDDENGPYQALILAAAGILRLDWEQRIHRVPNNFLVLTYLSTCWLIN